MLIVYTRSGRGVCLWRLDCTFIAEEESMTRISTFALALGCATALATQAANAQSDKVKTTVKTDDAKLVTYVGCVQTGPQARSYVLDHVAPVSKTTERSADGSTTTTTTYALV